MNTHLPVTLVAGDTWQFDAMLLDPSGNPLDLTNATVEWTMLDVETQQPVIPKTDVEIVVNGPGAVTVTIQPTATTSVGGGQYGDWWRVTLVDGITQTLLHGGYDVIADPFANQAAAAVAKPPKERLPQRTVVRLVA